MNRQRDIVWLIMPTQQSAKELENNCHLQQLVNETDIKIKVGWRVNADEIGPRDIAVVCFSQDFRERDKRLMDLCEKHHSFHAISERDLRNYFLEDTSKGMLRFCEAINQMTRQMNIASK